MAPKAKVAGAGKLKAAAKGKKSAGASSSGPAEPLVAAPPLIGVRLRGKKFDELAGAVASGDNEYGATNLLLTTEDQVAPEAGYYPVFAHSIYSGLVPPFSEFLTSLLSFYDIKLLHLQPKSICILSIFSYFCEVYLGIRPSLPVFLHFYALRVTARSEVTGSLSFRLKESMKGVYIPIHRKGKNIETSIPKNVEDYRARWVFMKMTGQHTERFELPEGLFTEGE